MKNQRTDAELNRIIAEWLGWISVSSDNLGRPPNTTDRYIPIQNYCTDLNAMRKAEQGLNANTANLYRKILSGITNAAYVGSEHPHLCYAEHAEARQRAEALVAVIEESKS